MGPTYRWNVITASALNNPAYLQEANQLFNDEQAGILTNTGGDFLGT